jgi:hypothetical protein
MAYRANITDKQQVDIERAQDDSAIRFPWFDGKSQQAGAVKGVRALDAQPNGGDGEQTSDARKMVSGSIAGGIGSHDDHPSRFETPGKA